MIICGDDNQKIVDWNNQELSDDLGIQLTEHAEKLKLMEQELEELLLELAHEPDLRNPRTGWL